jgi:hypothetical protein
MHVALAPASSSDVFAPLPLFAHWPFWQVICEHPQSESTSQEAPCAKHEPHTPLVQVSHPQQSPSLLHPSWTSAHPQVPLAQRSEQQSRYELHETPSSWHELVPPPSGESLSGGKHPPNWQVRPPQQSVS